jgi:uncharacterized protein (TIGR02996 family)
VSASRVSVSVHFVYRSPYEGPSGKRVVHFDDTTVLDWFRAHWESHPYPVALDREEALFRGQVYGFASLFDSIAEHDLAVPYEETNLWNVLAEHLAVERQLLPSPHCIQVLTDDDELELAYYFFDDEFICRNPGSAEYLLSEGWRLPDGCTEPGFVTQIPTTLVEPTRFFSQGTTYLVFLRHSEADELTHPSGGYRIEGIRLPDLTQHLATHSPLGWPFELLLLRSQLLADEDAPTPEERAFLAELREKPAEGAGWQMYADWLAEHGETALGARLLGRALDRIGRLPVRDLEGLAKRPGFYAAGISEARRELEEYVFTRARHRTPGVPSLSVSFAAEHLAQLCAHVDRLESPTRDVFHQWYLFDDLWAAAHPALANGLFRYARRWDVLTVEAPPS